jgi:hypothetical protein
LLWELRYRSPRAIDDVLLETVTDQEPEARELAELFLQTLSSPSIRFVRLRPMVVARSVDHPDLLAKYEADRGARRKEPARVGA